MVHDLWIWLGGSAFRKQLWILNARPWSWKNDFSVQFGEGPQPAANDNGLGKTECHVLEGGPNQGEGEGLSHNVWDKTEELAYKPGGKWSIFECH